MEAEPLATPPVLAEFHRHWPCRGEGLFNDGPTSAETATQVADLLAARKSLFRDFGASLSRDEAGIGRLSLNEEGSVILTTPMSRIEFQPGDPFIQQFITEIRMPRPYWDTLSNEGLVELLAHDANRLATHFGARKGARDRMLLRGMVRHHPADGTTWLQARALLSDHFAFIDHDFAFGAIRDHLAHAPLHHWEILLTPFTFYVSAEGPFLTQEALFGLEPAIRTTIESLGNIQIGWTVTNSETGQGSLKIQPRIHIGKDILTMDAEKEKWVHRSSKLAFDPTTCHASAEPSERLQDLQTRVVATCERVVSREGYFPILAQIATAESTQPKDASLSFARLSRQNEIASRLRKEDREAILALIADRSATTNLSVLDVARAAASRAESVTDPDHQAEISEVAGILVRLAGSSLWGAR